MKDKTLISHNNGKIQFISGVDAPKLTKGKMTGCSRDLRSLISYPFTDYFRRESTVFLYRGGLELYGGRRVFLRFSKWESQDKITSSYFGNFDFKSVGCGGCL